MTDFERPSRHAAHPGDGDLILLLDAPEECATVKAHVAECQACQDRLARHARRSRALHEVFARYPEPVPSHAEQLHLATRPRPVVPWLTLSRAAFLLVAVGTAAALPVAIRLVVARMERPASPPPPAPAPEVPRRGPTVEFAPAGSELAITYAAPPGGGALTLVSGPGETNSAQITRVGNGESLVILPDGLRVLNQAGAAPDVRVVLAAGVRRVRVSVTGQGVPRLVTLVPGDTLILSLAVPPARTPPGSG